MYKSEITNKVAEKKFLTKRTKTAVDLHKMETTIATILDSDLISAGDKFKLKVARQNIDEIILNWDDDYTNKLIQKLTNEVK